MTGQGDARAVAPTTTASVPVPSLAQRDRGERARRGDVLYRIYLVVLFGGFYGSVLVRTLMSAAVPALDRTQLALLGAAGALVPVLAALGGVRFGRWAGPVPITRPEASILLPSLVDRRALLRPRLVRSELVAVVLGAAIGLVAVVLIALSGQVGGLAWVTLPLLGATGGLLVPAASAVSQATPLTRGRHRLATVALTAVAAGLGVAASTDLGREPLATLGASLVGVASGDAAVPLLAIAVVVTVAVAGWGRRAIVGAHDEELASRAGLHAGLAASAQLGDLRAISLSRTPTARARALRSLPHPRRPSLAILWRHLTALRAHPAPLVRCAIGWAAATLLVLPFPDDVRVTTVLFRVALASLVLYLGTSPLLEPLRREHDSPLASEVLPFGFATLTWMHTRAALLVATLVGYLSVPTALAAVGALERPWLVVVTVPAIALVTVSVAADRVRQPATIAEVMVNLPAGMAAEVVGIALAATLIQPVLAMLPVGLPFGLAMAAPILPFAPAPLVVVAIGYGVLVVALRVAGMWLWLRSYEQALHDAELLEPTSSLGLAWDRARAALARVSR